MNHFRQQWGEEAFLAAFLPNTVLAMPMYGDKFSSFWQVMRP